MLEALTHKVLKTLLHSASLSCTHTLTFGRIVARNLLKKENSLIELHPGIKDQGIWWLGLLIPLSLEGAGKVLVLSSEQRKRLLEKEIPLLQKDGLAINWWEGLGPPPKGQLWCMDYFTLISAHYKGYLNSRKIIFPSAALLSEHLSDVLSIQIRSEDWSSLIRANPHFESSIIHLYERIGRRISSASLKPNCLVRVELNHILALKQLIFRLSSLPKPWNSILKVENSFWTGWACVDKENLTWSLSIKHLFPMKEINTLFKQQSVLLIDDSKNENCLIRDLKFADCSIDLKVRIGSSNPSIPLKLFAPTKQPLPNTPEYSKHLLSQCFRLLIGFSEKTIILLDDDNLRHKLTSELASSFGKRVLHESTSLLPNCVVCCRCSWWLENHNLFSSPKQLIIALLPLASLDQPLTAAKVQLFKQMGHDWFRELLLPDALSSFTEALMPVRATCGRLAILDGRVYKRKWGQSFLSAIEPWQAIHHLILN